MKPGAVGVAVVAIALVGGGLFFGLGGSSDDADSTASVPLATLPPSTVAPPPPAVVGTDPADTVEITDETDTLPVPNVIGVSQATAESRLTDFEVQVVVADATDAAFFDEVSDQTPAAAQRLPAGATVTITVSMQPTPETIPADLIPVGAFAAMNLTTLADGDCANGALLEEALVYERVECDEFHDVQLIARFDVTGAPADFDALALDELIRDQCEQRYTEFVGVEIRESTLLLRTVRPDAERYVAQADRTSLCLVVSPLSARIQGSAENSLW